MGSATRACGCHMTVSLSIVLELNLIGCPFVLVGQKVLIEDASGTATLSTSSEDVDYYLLRQRPEVQDFTEDNTSLPTLDIQ